MALAFCMGADLQALADSEQPMAQIFVNSFGQNATLGIWVLVVLIQCVSPSPAKETRPISSQIHDGFEHGNIPHASPPP